MLDGLLLLGGGARRRALRLAARAGRRDPDRPAADARLRPAAAHAVGVSLVCVIVTSGAAAGVYLERRVANLRLGHDARAVHGDRRARRRPRRVPPARSASLELLFAGLLVYVALTMARRRDRGPSPAGCDGGAGGRRRTGPPTARRRLFDRRRLSGPGYRVRRSRFGRGRQRRRRRRVGPARDRRRAGQGARDARRDGRPAPGRDRDEQPDDRASPPRPARSSTCSAAGSIRTSRRRRRSGSSSAPASARGSPIGSTSGSSAGCSSRSCFTLRGRCCSEQSHDRRPAVAAPGADLDRTIGSDSLDDRDLRLDPAARDRLRPDVRAADRPALRRPALEPGLIVYDSSPSSRPASSGSGLLAVLATPSPASSSRSSATSTRRADDGRRAGLILS